MRDQRATPIRETGRIGRGEKLPLLFRSQGVSLQKERETWAVFIFSSNVKIQKSESSFSDRMWIAQFLGDSSDVRRHR